MSGMLDTIDFTLDYPQCGKKIKEKLGRLHKNRCCTCPTCGRVAVTGNVLSRISRSVQEFEREISGFSKTLKIKL